MLKCRDAAPMVGKVIPSTAIGRTLGLLLFELIRCRCSGRLEGENRISFELSTAVGGKILNVRHYDERKDRHNSQTYVIPNGEDLGDRVAKIINLEQYR